MDNQLRGLAGELQCVLGPEYRVLGMKVPEYSLDKYEVSTQWLDTIR